MPKQIVVYCTSWCPDCLRTKRLLKQLGVAFDLVDIEEVAGAELEMRRRNGGSGKVPTVLIGDELCLLEPSDAEIRQALTEHCFASPASS